VRVRALGFANALEAKGRCVGRGDQVRRLRRHAFGEIPFADVKVRVKWLCSEKPASSAMSTRLFS
jgi:hypothetical protein